MRTWIRVQGPRRCGGCPAELKRNDVALEVHNGGGTRLRCTTCAVRLFREAPPSDIPDLPPLVAVPQPSLPLERVARQPDFVTTKQLAQSVVLDAKQRQTGERE